jgi:hypothetical protein
MHRSSRRFAKAANLLTMTLLGTQRYDSERNYPTLANRGLGWGTRNELPHLLTAADVGHRPGIRRLCKKLPQVSAETTPP